MSTMIRINIEDELYNAVKSITEEKDISISDSIVAYFRAVVQTNSLAIDTSLTSAPRQYSFEQPMLQMKMDVQKAPRKMKTPPDFTQVPLPTEEPAIAPEEEPSIIPVSVAERAPRQVTIPELTGSPVDKYITLICSIPDGLLSTWEDMEAVVGSPKPLHDEWPRTIQLRNDDGEEKVVAIPYWRVLSWQGSTKGEVTCSRDLRETMLKAEGHEVITTARGMKVVRDYKKKLVKWDA